MARPSAPSEAERGRLRRRDWQSRHGGCFSSLRSCSAPPSSDSCERSSSLRSGSCSSEPRLTLAVSSAGSATCPTEIASRLGEDDWIGADDSPALPDSARA
eukprot:7004537-Pyramimonas_sp.AAC.1